MTAKERFSRRRFLVNAAGAAVAAPCIVPSSVLGGDEQVAPSNRITVGMIGVGRQVAAYNLRQFVNNKDTQVVALCDVDRWRLALTNDRITSVYGAKRRCGKFSDCSRYTDFRDILARNDIDAVMISTTDHWHVPIALAAVRAGKDVCLEKPITRSIQEGRILSDFVAKHKRVFRTDSEFRSKPHFHRAVELVRNGYIGKLQTIRTGVPVSDFSVSPPFVKMPVPKELDYDMWLGPAQKAEYTEKRVHQHKGYERPGWMRIRDYCDGMITNWGTHLNDIAQWGAGTERTGPVEVEGTGTWPPKGGMWNVLLEFEVRYRYANGMQLIYKTESPYCRFEGTEGWIQANFPHTLDAEPKSLLTAKIKPDGVRFPLKSEKRDFLDCVKSRGQTLEDAEVGHRTTSLCHLGYIAVQVGQRLNWDPETERFTNSDEANKLLATPPLREPWTLERMMKEI